MGRLPRYIPGQYHIGTMGLPIWDCQGISQDSTIWDYGTVGLISNLYGTAKGYPATVLYWDYGTAKGYPRTVPLIWDYGTVGHISNLYGTAEGYPGTIPYWDYGTVGVISNLYGTSTAEGYPGTVPYWD